jgi:type I restriction enzyme S subunit
MNDRGQNAGPEDLPDGWSYAPLEQVCDPVLAVDPKKHFEHGFSYIDISSINAEELRIVAAKHVSKRETPPSRARQLVNSGDTLLSTVRVYLRNVAIVSGEYDGQIASTGLCVLRGSIALEHRFLFHFVTGRSFTNTLLPLQRGNSPPAVLEEDIKAQRIPVPPINEQRRIVEKIDELFSDIEQGEAALRRAKTLLQRYRQAVLKAAVTGELTRDWRARHQGEIETGEQLLARILETRRAAWEKAELGKMTAKGQRPKNDSWKRRYKEPTAPDTAGFPALPEGWVWASIGQLFRVFIGSTPSRSSPEFWGGEVPWVSSGEVAFCRIKSTKERISTLGLERSSTRIHPPGTVLLAMIGEGRTRGQAAILDLAACNNQNAAAIRVSETPVLPEYVYLFLEHRYEITRRAGKGGNQPALNKDRVEAICIPLPPLAEMEEIVRVVDEMLIDGHKIASDLGVEQGRVAALRQSILRAAFAGKLVPQDANDEPASVLLERIAAERATMKTAGRPRRGRKREREEPEKVAERLRVREPVLG